MCALLVSLSVSASYYEVDPWQTDTVEAYEAVLKDSAWGYADSHAAVALVSGTVVESVSPQTGEGVTFALDGRHYRVPFRDVKFVGDSSGDSVNPQSMSMRLRHSAIGYFYATMAPAVTVIALLVLCFLMYVTGVRFEAMRKLALAVMPVCIAGVALLELAGYLVVGSDEFWWCDYDRYGFWGSLWRFLPFAAVVAVQVISIRWFERVLFAADDDDYDGERRISVKPAVLGLVCCLPVLVIYMLIADAWLDFRGPVSDIIAVVLFFVTLVSGVGLATYRNMKRFGKARGSVISVFTIVYILGCIVASAALLVLLFKLLIQILMVAAGVALVMVMGQRRRYRDSWGREYEEDGFGNRTRIN